MEPTSGRLFETMVHCTVSQAPLSLVEFKTWPVDLTRSTGTFCGLMPVPSFAMRFFKDFQRFCPLLPDLVLQLDSGERVNVHRVLFYCCSAYCRQKLKAQQAEKDCWPSSFPPAAVSRSSKIDAATAAAAADIIRVPQVDYESLRAVVDFVYSGGLLDRVCLDSLPRLRFAATLLGIDEMVTVCDSLFRVYQQQQQQANGDATRLLKSESPPLSPCKRNAASNKHQQRLPSVASVLAEMGRPDSRLRLLPAAPRIKQEDDGATFSAAFQAKRRSCHHEATESPSTTSYLVQLIAYSKEDLVISEKYIYSSRITEFQPLLSTYNVLQYLDEGKAVHDQDSLYYETATMQQKRRHSLILFSLSTEQEDVWTAKPANGRQEDCLKISLISSRTVVNDAKCLGRDTQRFALLCRLDFSDRNSLFSCCQRVLTNFMRGLLPANGAADEKTAPQVLVELNLDALYCLKKSCGFKSSFRRESLLSTSECYKALAEYSRPERGELPLVLLSCSGMFHLESDDHRNNR